MTCMTLSTMQAYDLLAAARRGEQEQLARRHGVRHVLGDAVAEVARQVLDGVGAQLLEAVHVVGVVGIELVAREEAVDLGGVGEGEAVPVDDRAAAQEQAHGLDVAERRLLEAGDVLARRAPPLVRRRLRSDLSSAAIVVLAPF